MAKLYPPYIEGTLPAFGLYIADTIDSDGVKHNAGDGTIIIPFAHNKAVSKSDTLTIALKVKTVQNDVLITSFQVPQSGYNKEGWITLQIKDYIVQGNYLSESSKKWEVAIGQYYKIQIAYLDQDKNMGYYSTVGVIKCTSYPSLVTRENRDGDVVRTDIVSGVGIQNLRTEAINNNRTEFIGCFIQPAGGDVTEKVYSSRFIITDLEGNEIVDTGEVLHNVENNPNSYTSTDLFEFNQDLEYGIIYKIRYIVTTNNNLTISSPTYLLMQQKSLQMSLKGSLIAELNYEEAYVDISIKGYVDENGVEEIGNGAYILSRQDNLNPGHWRELTRFSLKYESPTREIFRDFTIEQGKTYTYSIQQYNSSQVFSARKKSNAVKADFEDMFLYDVVNGQPHQLKMRFDPKVSNFKTQLQETVGETIGSKYPYFYRNARIGYKTFPISATVSMLSDDNELFITHQDILREDFDYDRHDMRNNIAKVPRVYDHHWEVSENYTSERLFKNAVLDWLNNGKVKLFKSPQEGNYLVRMKDNSLTPNDTLGRMIHSMSGTAYEVAEYNYDNMLKYGIIQNNSGDVSITDTYVTNWRDISIAEMVDNGENIFSKGSNYSQNLLQSDLDQPYTTSLRFIDFMPGTKIRIVFALNADPNSTDSLDLMIGATGNYYADDIKPVYGIYLIKDPNLPEDQLNPVSLEGNIHYEYKVPARSKFEAISSITTDVGSNAQFVGTVDNLIKSLTTIREEPTKICMSDYKKRPVEFLYTPYNFLRVDDDSVAYDFYSHMTYWDVALTEDFNEEDSKNYSPFTLYLVKSLAVDKDSIISHITRSLSSGDNEQDLHQAQHLFEKYYIDRYVAASTAEEEITALSNIYSKIKAEQNVAEKKVMIESIQDAYVVLDPYNEKVYCQYPFNLKLEDNDSIKAFIYDPSITYNGSKIDLREIERYDLDNLDSNEANITVGNGVYGEIYYQRVVTSYGFESKDSLVKSAKDAYNQYYQNIYNNLYLKGITPSKSLLTELQRRYDLYNKNLTQAVENWTKREEAMKGE